MQLFENIGMALTSVRSNKMRSLLTMLGIIIGIAAVIAIETVGNSMTGSVMDSMSGMGASNISVTVTQKSSSDTSGTLHHIFYLLSIISYLNKNRGAGLSPCAPSCAPSWSSTP